MLFEVSHQDLDAALERAPNQPKLTTLPPARVHPRIVAKAELVVCGRRASRSAKFGATTGLSVCDSGRGVFSILFLYR